MARLGSFAAPVDLPEHLRPWLAAGLDALFLPDGLPEAAAQLAHSNPPADPAGEALPASIQAATANDWPEPWHGLAARVRTAPKIIITYASLTADLSGAANPARRKLLQSILGYLAWPQGTSLFWPCTDLAQAQPLARNIFLNGVLSFGVRHIVCFGPEAASIASALFPAAASPNEIQVYALPDLEHLANLLPHELHRAVALLKGLRLE